MALNPSGPISLGGSTAGQSVNLELGQSATATISLGDSNVRALAGVPSGPISLDDLHGKSAVSVYISSTSIVETQFSPVSAYAAYTLANDGKVYTQTTYSGSTFFENWITPQSNMSDYECYATVVQNSGSSNSGTFGSWLNLGGSQGWTSTRSSLGTSILEFTLAIRRVGTSTNLTTATIYLETNQEI